MNAVPVLLAVVGVGLLVAGWLAFSYLRRSVRLGLLPQQWRRRRKVGVVVGALLVLTIPWQAYPLGKGTALGIPFFAAWYDERGRDFLGAITLPALLGDAVVWFLIPQLVLAYFARRQSAAQPSAPPNGGPAERLGGSGASVGPPSVS
jgi:hypothetical protein